MGDFHALVIAGGQEDDPDRVRRFIGPYQWAVAADGGYRLARRLGIECGLLVGDFDTLSASEVAEAESAGVVVERHRPDKDQSDLELAIAHALRMGATRVTLVGALGGAWDHCLVNLLSPLSMLAGEGSWGRLLTSEAEIYLCDREVEVRAPGRRVTLQALSPRVEGLTLEGFEYPLEGAVLGRHQTLGLANRAVEESARISLHTGELFLTVITSHSQTDES